MVDVESCQDSAVEPALRVGDFKHKGSYHRAVKKEHLVTHYEDDRERPHLAGIKFSNQMFRELLKQIGFSVNCCECQPDPSCTLSWISNSKFSCVIRLDVEVLAHLTQKTVVAQYDPTPNNKCHFNIVAPDESEDAFKLLLRDRYNSIVEPLPRGKKLPRNDESQMRAVEAIRKKVQSIFTVVLSDE